MRGFTPAPDLGFFFGKKNPKDPKKPDWIGFRLSSIDSEQGCRRQPCFMFSENCSYSLSDEIWELIVCSFKNYAAKRNKANSFSSLLLLSMGAALPTSARKTKIVSESYAKVNSPNLLGLEQSLRSSTHWHNQEKGMDS